MASSGQNNFSFMNRKQRTLEGELEQYLRHLMKTRDEINGGKITFNDENTYMTFILGDGDNVAFMKGSRRAWMDSRVKKCNEQEGGCSYPLAWSMSPHITYLSPDMIKFYYR